MRLRVTFIAAIYRKCLKLSISHTSSTGLIVNLISNDVQRFEDASPFALFLYLGPIELLIVFWFLWKEIHWGALSGVIALLCLIPIQGLFAKFFAILRKQTVKFRDTRIR